LHFSNQEKEMNIQSITYPEKPTLVNVIAWTTLASGIVNLGWGLVVSATAFITIIGICCTPLTILPAILGIFEIIYAAKLLSVPQQPVRPAINLAVLEIVCILTGNLFSMVVGILSLIFYNDPAVKEYFARLNGDATPGTVPPAPPQIPPFTPIVTPAPVEESIPSPIAGDETVVPPAPVEEFEEQASVPPVEEAPVVESEPSAPPVPSEPGGATDETIVSSLHKYEPPTTEEPNPPDQPTEE
jgi:hypothetical protein